MPPRSRRKQRAPRCMWAVAEVTRRRRQTVSGSSSMSPMLHLHRMPRRIRHELLAKSNFEARTPPVVPPQPPVAIVLLRWSNHGANLSRSWDPRMDGSWVWISSVMPHGHAWCPSWHCPAAEFRIMKWTTAIRVVSQVESISRGSLEAMHTGTGNQITRP